MAFEVYYDEEHDCLVGVFAGKLNEASAEEYMKTFVEMASEHDCKFILNDLREAELDLNTFQLYVLPAVLDAAGIDRSWIRAIVMPIQLKQLADFRFFETVAINRGYQVKLFTDPDEAKNWFKQQRHP
jgi:hypothetical protein